MHDAHKDESLAPERLELCVIMLCDNQFELPTQPNLAFSSLDEAHSKSAVDDQVPGE